MPSLDELSSKIQDLNIHYQTLGESNVFREQVVVAYYKDILSKLISIYDSTQQNPDARQEELKEFLADNWNFIKNTALSYTALPQSDITLLLINIAELVVAKENEKAPGSLPKGVLHVLMPTVNTHHISTPKENLHPDEHNNFADINVQEILNTHIIGRQGNMLIPVSLITTLTTYKDTEKLYNPYYDFDEHEEDLATLSKDEVRRLKEFAQATRAVFDAMQDYDALRFDDSNLLGQLEILTSHLYFNSVHGRGEEKAAGLGVDAALINFRNYYEGLGAEVQQTIPEDIKKELTTLFNFTDPKQQNQNQTQSNTGSCIAIRRGRLLETIAQHKEALVKIGIVGESKEALLKKAERRFNESKETLENELESKTTTGFDKLGINLAVMKKLNCELHLSNPDDLVLFNQLSPPEITELCQEESIQQQLVGAIGTFENLVVFCLQTAPDKLEALLKVASEPLAKKFINLAEDLSALLITLNSEKLKVVASAFISIIKSTDDFVFVMKNISPQQRETFFEVFKGQLRSIIKNGHDFSDVIRCLPEQQQDVFFVDFKDNLPTLIKNGQDFAHVFSSMPKYEMDKFFNLFRDQLPNLIENGDDLVAIMKELPENEQDNLFEALKDKLPIIIKDSSHFVDFLNSLSQQKTNAFLELMKDEFVIGGMADLVSIGLGVSEAKIDRFSEIFKVKFPDLIKSVGDLNLAMMLFPKKHQQVSFLEFYKAHFPKIIKNKNDCKQIVNTYTPDQRLLVLDSFKDNLPDFVNSFEELQEIFKVEPDSNSAPAPRFR